jgi:serine/threonine protein kinase
VFPTLAEHIVQLHTAAMSGFLSPWSPGSERGEDERTEQTMLVLKHIVSGEEPVYVDRPESTAFRALGIREEDPKLWYRWSEDGEPLGRGGFSTVFKATQVPLKEDTPPSSGKTRLTRVRSRGLSRRFSTDSPRVGTPSSMGEGGREFALKVIRNLRSRDEDSRQKLWREVAVMRMLSLAPTPSANLLPLIDAFMWEETLYIVLPLAIGGTVPASSREGSTSRFRWSERDIAGVIEGVLNGLALMHSLGCVHNDIKHFNLLRLDTGLPPKVVIADYGEALIVDETRSGRRARSATPLFAPPEFMEERGDYSPATDIFAIGVTTCVLLTGAFPFDEKGLLDAAGNVRADWMKLPGALVHVDERSCGFRNLGSKEVKDFVRCCCSADPSLRPTATQALAHAWLQSQGKGAHRDKGIKSLSKCLQSSFVDAYLHRQPGSEHHTHSILDIHPDQVLALQSEFYDHVVSGSEMDYPTFCKIMRRLECDDVDLRSMFHAFDVDNSGGVDFKELLDGLKILGSNDVEAKVSLLFAMYDSEGKGRLTERDITRSFRAISHDFVEFPEFKSSVEHMSAVLFELCDADGTISRESLVTAIVRDRSLLLMFLKPFQAVKEIQERRRWSKWRLALAAAIGETLVRNWIRTLYLLIVLACTVLLVLDWFEVFYDQGGPDLDRGQHRSQQRSVIHHPNE